MVLAFALTFALQADPHNLPLGRAGSTPVVAGRITDLRSGAAATADDVAKAADGRRFVLLGEQHATPAHQAMQASLIDALRRRGRKVVIGLEMLTRPKQPALDAYIRGELDESAFLISADWKTQWGYDFGYYRPVFDLARRYRMPMVALNAPREWVRAVGRGGVAALPSESGLSLEGQLAEAGHRQVFDSLMGGHPVTGPAGENMYAAQVLWDVAMADSAAKAVGRDRRTVVVVIAGSGHVMYGQGIGLRLAKSGKGESLTVVMLERTEEGPVANGLGDFVYVSAAPRK